MTRVPMTGRYRVVIAALSAVVVVLAVVLAWSFTQSGKSGIRSPAPPSSPASPTFNPRAGDADTSGRPPGTDPNEAAWRPVVENFGRNFTNTTGGAAKWRSRLLGDPRHPQLTANLIKQLRTVDVANVPAGTYQGYKPIKGTEYDAAVKVSYREGWAMVLYLITDGTDWQVYAYDRWQH